MPLLDQYPDPVSLPDFSGSIVDPKELERAKALALMRMGFGMAGREPAGRAMQGGINTYVAGLEEARRYAATQQQMAIARYQAERAYQDDLRKVSYIRTLKKDQLLAAGVPEVLVDAVQNAKDPPEAVMKLQKFFEPQTLGPSQVVRSPLGGVQFQTAGPKGEMVQYDDRGPVAFGMVPNAVGAQAALAGAVKGAETTAEQRAKASYEPMELPVSGQSGKKETITKEQWLKEQGGWKIPPSVQAERDQRRLEILNSELAQAKAEGNRTNIAALEKEIAMTQGKNVTGATATLAGRRVSDPLAMERQKQISGAYVEQVKKDFPIAFSAAENAIPMAQNALDALNSGKIITGKGADIKRELGGWLATFGVKEAEDPVANTQAFIANMARETTALLQSGAFGAGTGIGQKDLEFAQNMSGSDPTLTEDAIRKIITLNLKAHRAKIAIHNETVRRYADVFDEPSFLKLYSVNEKPSAAALEAEARRRKLIK